MGKPTIILADTDELYLSTLELKFLEELGDKIELEIITEQEYFNEHFSSPQSAEILVVSENLYFSELQKQNISNIFVLTESMDEGGTEDLGITKIFKYTTIKEIYNQVTATSSGIIHSETSKSKETKVVLFYSGAGGVGKTTLAMAISYCLTKSFKKALYINAHRVNSFQFYLNNTTAVPNNIYTDLLNADSNIFNRIKHVIRNEEFDYLPPFGASLSSLNLNFYVYEEIIKSAKATKEYDIIVVDTDTSFDSSKASLINLADQVIIVTTQSKASVNATNMLIKNMNCHDNEKFIFVCNDFREDKYNALTGKDFKANFTVNEYVKHIADIDELKISDISNSSEIQKLAYLIV